MNATLLTYRDHLTDGFCKQWKNQERKKDCFIVSSVKAFETFANVFQTFSNFKIHSPDFSYKNVLWFLWKISWSISCFMLLLRLPERDACVSGVRQQSGILGPAPGLVSSSPQGTQWCWPSRRVGRPWLPQAAGVLGDSKREQPCEHCLMLSALSTLLSLLPRQIIIISGEFFFRLLLYHIRFGVFF